MLESGTPGEPEGYEFVMLLEVAGSVLLGSCFAGSRRQENVSKSWPDILPLSYL
jgi:hypothetical protein